MITNIEHINAHGSAHINEDQFLIQPEHGLFAVFDGGLIAAETARDVFSSTSGTLVERAIEANLAIEAVHKRLHIDTTLLLVGVRLILLLTDGMFLPKPDPNAPEDWKALIDIYHRGGLQGIVNEVRFLEAIDPTLDTYPRYKLHDDATAIALEFA